MDSNEIAVDRRLLRALAERCAYPPTRLSSVLLADAGAWAYAISNSTPSERVELLLSLRHELLAASEGGRLRLAQPHVHGLEIDEQPFVTGDAEAAPVVAAAFALMPDVAKWPLMREVAFVAVGWSSKAWTASARLADVTGQRKGRLVVLGPAADVKVILHELGHCWSAGPPRRESSVVTVAGENGFAACAVRDGWSERLAAWERAEEMLAEALALTWLLSRAEGKVS